MARPKSYRRPVRMNSLGSLVGPRWWELLDGPEARAREAVHVLFAGEKVKPDYPTATPQLDEVNREGDFCVVALEALVRMKLTSYRRKDQVHLLDLAEVGLIDMTWCEKFIPSLAERLRELLENPD